MKTASIIAVSLLMAGCAQDRLLDRGGPEEPSQPEAAADPSGSDDEPDATRDPSEEGTLPIAVAAFRQADPQNTSAPYTNPDTIVPLDRVYLDGRGSYDPRDPDDDALIVDYRWDIVEYPAGANPDDFDLNGTRLASFWAPIAGDYVARLTVTNTQGMDSADEARSRLLIHVVPDAGLHVQLVWDNPSNDQDLHMTHVAQSDELCAAPWDVHWQNQSPVWFNDDPAGSGANPTLDIDDTNGLGPENINIRFPRAGVYRIYVHYFGDFNIDDTATTPTRNTVRVYLHGTQVGEYSRTLQQEDDAWLVGEVHWDGADVASVLPATSDSPGETGQVFRLDGCGFDIDWEF